MSAADALTGRRARAADSEYRCFAALGDSFTAGVPDPVTGHVPTGKRWADLVAEALRRRNPALEHRNLAVAGASSREVIEGQITPTAALHPDLLTLFCGANDVLLSTRPDVPEYAAALSAAFAQLRAELPEAELLTATCPDLSGWVDFGPRTRERVRRGIAELNEATRTVAADHGVGCLEFANHPWAGRRESFAADGVHPSREGHQAVAAAFLGALSKRPAPRTIGARS